MTIVLVHSPLTGPSVWDGVADSLRRGGRRVSVPSFADVFASGPPYHDAVAESVGRQITEAAPSGAVVLVAHSGAGALLPTIAEAVPQAAGAVFVDALLPHPGESWLESVLPEMREHLLGLAEDGVLPKWSDWFGPEVTAQLLPDADIRERFVEELPRIPLAYLEETTPESEVWPPPRCAYVRLSEVYRDYAAEAERMGWPVRHLDGDHLAIMTRPDETAALLTEILNGWP
ncbi:alpha/beta fold hydrolase [Glycomyces halotolerans]